VAEQETYLAEMKAAMTPEELEQMVKDTLAFDQWNASEQSNSDIVISVADLPALEAGPEFHKEEEDGALYYTAACQSEKISLHRLCSIPAPCPRRTCIISVSTAFCWRNWRQKTTLRPRRIT
jgi:hypothetical protein